ncbi:MAG: response regulator transcription factor [Anaerolineae bacterium]|jgi:NarL family two-component system response regulator LiaR
MSGEGPIRVMIVDDHAVVRKGVRFSLLAFDDLELVGEAETGEEALRLCEQVKPDVILVDMVMPGMDGVATTCAILEHSPHVQVIVLTSFQEGDLVQSALGAGAIGYLLKDASMDDLAEAIRSAYAGRTTLAPAAAQALAKTAADLPAYQEKLTQRQREVLALIVEGLGNAEIAERLGISLPTARFHVSTILSKLGAANRAEAAALAIKYQLI